MSRLFVFGLSVLIALSCGSSKKIAVSRAPIQIDGNLSDWANILPLTKAGSPVVAKVARDAEFLYVYIWFSDRRSFEDALQYGLTVYAENPKSPKRSFGITIPTGILNELAAFPGARQAFLSDLQWAMQPANRNLLQQIEAEMPTRALITFRKLRSEPLTRWPLPLVQLAAMDVHITSDPQQPTATELRIPLKTSRVRQFGVEVSEKDPIRIGFEIKPPSYEEIVQDQEGLNPQLQGMDRVGRNAAGPNQRGMMMGGDQQLQMRQMMMMRMGTFEKWFILKP